MLRIIVQDEGDEHEDEDDSISMQDIYPISFDPLACLAHASTP